MPWTDVGALRQARMGHTATLLTDGRVLVTGGIDPEMVDGAVLRSVEAYVPSTRRWERVARMPTARTQHTATRLADGRVLVVGGYDGSGPSRAVAIFDPATNAWTPARRLAQARHLHAAVRLRDGSVLVAGGAGAGGALSSCERYDPSTNTWTAAPNLPWPRAALELSLVRGGVLAYLGHEGSRGERATAQLRRGAWVPRGLMRSARRDDDGGGAPSVDLPRGQILAVSGYSSGFLRTSERYNGTSWVAAARLRKVHTTGAAAALPRGRVLVCGGSGSGNPLPDAEVWAPGSGWRRTDPMHQGRWVHTATRLRGSGVLVAGGAVPGGDPRRCEIYR